MTATTITNEVTASDVREWARGKGLTVGDRGRIPVDVIQRFNARRKPERRFYPADQSV